MSVPQTLDLPEGVQKVWAPGRSGEIATISISAKGPLRGRVVMIPGWTGSKEDFAPLLPLLAEAGFDAMAYDQAGQYESELADDYSLVEFALDALRMNDVAGPYVHLLGHSFGGLVAQQAAVLDPDVLGSVSLLDTGPGALGDSAQRPLTMLANAIGNVPMEQIHELRENGIVRPPEIAAFLRERALANDPASLKAMTQLLIDTPDIVDEVAATRLPVWVGRGEDDDAWPHDVQAAMASRLGTEIHVIPDSEHSPAIENPEGLIDAWLPFLLSHR